MKVTDYTRERLRCLRERKKLLAAGYEEIGEGGGRLWDLYRGVRYDCRIVDAVVAPEGKTVFVKIEREPIIVVTKITGQYPPITWRDGIFWEMKS